MVFMWGKFKSLSELKGVYGDVGASYRTSVKIAIIDDETVPYLESLRNSDFLIHHFKDIESINSMQGFDIILVDIKGVGKKFESDFGGAFLISELRKFYPFKIIVAYTGQSFDASYNNYFSMADDVLKKDIDYDTWVDSLDQYIQLSLDPIKQWKRMREYLLKKEIDLIRLVKLEDEYVTGFQKKLHIFPSKKNLERLPEDLRSIVNSFAASLIFKVLIGS
jgi:hypothetical protein